MDNYILQFPTFTKKIIYDFYPGCNGGIGDYIKFFMCTLNLCIQYNIQIYLKVHNTPLEKFLKLKHSFFYIYDHVECRNCSYDEIPNLPEDIYNIIMPHMLHYNYTYETINNIQDVFYFSNEVISNSYQLCPLDNYISIHLRLGDRFLETDQAFNQCYHDIRNYNEEQIFKTIEENKNNKILFLCDNNEYKLKIKNKYNYVYITHANIAHTCFTNTTEQQILDAITEFYLITQSEKVYAGSVSGFSIVAAKFKNIPLIRLN